MMNCCISGRNWNNAMLSSGAICHPRTRVRSDCWMLGAAKVTRWRTFASRDGRQRESTLVLLEHVIDPLDLLKQLRSLVAPGGLAVITVPNDCSITQRAALAQGHIDSAFWVAPPDHLTYFDHASLTNVANETGWECVEMIGDFPVDWFLFHPGSNYVRDKSVGKAAHKARVQIENLIHGQPIEDVLRFWSATAKLGIGRDVTAFLRPRN